MEELRSQNLTGIQWDSFIVRMKCKIVIEFRSRRATRVEIDTRSVIVEKGSGKEEAPPERGETSGYVSSAGKKNLSPSDKRPWRNKEGPFRECTRCC